MDRAVLPNAIFFPDTIYLSRLSAPSSMLCPRYHGRLVTFGNAALEDDPGTRDQMGRRAAMGAANSSPKRLWPTSD